jgi:fatty acid desaturase
VFVHIQHHKHTNDAALDPDMFASSRPHWLLPLRWSLMEQYYQVNFVRNWRRHTRRDKLEVLCTIAFYYTAWFCVVRAGHGAALALYWLVPKLLATCALGWAFDYVPHRPHTVTRAESLYKCTSRVGGVFSADGVSLAVPLLNQHLHTIHHTYPSIPWYRYGAIYRAHKSEFDRLGNEPVPFFDAATSWW